MKPSYQFGSAKSELFIRRCQWLESRRLGLGFHKHLLSAPYKTTSAGIEIAPSRHLTGPSH